MFSTFVDGWLALQNDINAKVMRMGDKTMLDFFNVYAPGAEVGERLAYAFGAISGGALAYAYHDQLGSTRVWRWWNKGLTGRVDFGP